MFLPLSCIFLSLTLHLPLASFSLLLFIFLIRFSLSLSLSLSLSPLSLSQHLPYQVLSLSLSLPFFSLLFFIFLIRFSLSPLPLLGHQGHLLLVDRGDTLCLIFLNMAVEVLSLSSFSLCSFGWFFNLYSFVFFFLGFQSI